ncbi:MAG: thiamine pyrophosphate-dependent dehydrogenase E1 component subunit alpha [Gammaproteobacteria bacterium]|nr:thiamine pyrophosphate-dependent dehydrogenase E1 component subunit alpha [Gammaproteobacteria bacterium]
MIEEEIAYRYPQGKMRCPTHLSIGQEAAAVMFCENLRSSDLVVSTHRAHAHYLAKGGNLNALIAELYGKATGCTFGRGGSMNLSDLKAGFVASTAIVGNTVPIGTGLAFSQKLKKTDAVTGVFLGDAAVEEGAIYESLNFAVLEKLPVIFICENNLYSVNTPIQLRQPSSREIYKMADGIGAKAKKLDGNDVIASFDAVTDIVQDLRQNGGVWFLEFETYRYKVHCGPEDDNGGNTGRPRSEFNRWLARDPVKLLQTHLLAENIITLKEFEAWQVEIKQEVDGAFMFAEQSKFPLAKQLSDYGYADSHEKWLATVLAKQPEGVVA